MSYLILDNIYFFKFVKLIVSDNSWVLMWIVSKMYYFVEEKGKLTVKLYFIEGQTLVNVVA